MLTPRDVALIVACYEHQWLTREQLQKLTGIPGVTRMNQRLRQLYDHTFLQRLRAGTVGAGLQPIYTAGERALPLLAAQTEQPLSVLREHLREDARASEILLPHDLQVNDVRIALTSALRATPALRLDGWLNPRECFDAYAAGRALRPDGYFRFWQEELLHAFYLEVDRGTTNLARWRTRVERYVEYREGGFYTTRRGLQRFRVLILGPAPERLAHLREATESVTRRSFWFALTNELLADPDPRRPIWRPVGQSARRALIQA